MTPPTSATLDEQEAAIRLGGGAKAIERQHEKGRLTARERIAKLIDPDSDWFELGLWAAWNMYKEWGFAPSAGVVTGIGTVSDRRVMIVANDATVKAGAFFPMTCKKVLRAQRIATENRLPFVYLVDSAGVFLPLQDEVFPDEDDFGRIFRNNAVISAAGIPQFAAIMGNCVAGGGYLPVLCDTLLMTEGSGLYLAGPALVKAAIGQVVDSESLGGARMHAAVSGTIDFREPNDEACLERLHRLVGALPGDRRGVSHAEPGPSRCWAYPAAVAGRLAREIHAARIRRARLAEVAARWRSVRRVQGGLRPVARVRLGRTRRAARRRGCEPEDALVKTAAGPLQFGGVIYVDSADKAAQFVMDCNQLRVPILFVQNVNGFMVGKESEQQGIIPSRCRSW